MSYVLMSSERVAEMAQECIDRVRGEREQMYVEEAKEVQAEEERRASTWWGKLFQYSVRTEEEIISEIKRARHWDQRHFYFRIHVESHGEFSLSAAYRLLTAASVAKEVNVSAEDLSLILA